MDAVEHGPRRGGGRGLGQGGRTCSPRGRRRRAQRDPGLGRVVDVLRADTGARRDPPLRGDSRRGGRQPRLRGLGAAVARRAARDGGPLRARPELLAEANEIFEELGQTRYSSASDIDGIVELLAGDLDAAEGRLRAGYLALEKMGDRAFRPTTAAYLAEALYAQGRDEDAGPLTEISEQLAAKDDLLTQVVWRRVRAKVMARQGRIDEAEDLAQEAVKISEATDFLNTRADALVDLAHIHRRAGRLDEARTAIAKGIALYEAKCNRVAVERTRAHLAVLQQT